ncbi:MAG: MBL fold metallo-hydrolase, partial [Candidatus Neomarinimicrobiota bacterium]|nr:MBL fold metallo-hydrolase [Candidatus Neomarinimicrobiota bacterium]
IELENIKPFFKSSPSAIFVTHTHRDHIAYIGSYINNFPEINIVGHPESKNNFDNNKFIPVSDGSKMKIGNLKIKAIFTPGHYFDSICYLVENILFTGDTLFVGRTGRTISAGSDINNLYDSVYNKIFKLPGDTYIYPGHDYGEVPSIKIEENRKISDLLQAENKLDFIDKMDKYEKNRKIGS